MFEALGTSIQSVSNQWTQFVKLFVLTQKDALSPDQQMQLNVYFNI